MSKEQQELLDEAYKNWCRQFEVDLNNFNGEEVAKGHNDQCWGYPILDHVKPTSKEYKRGQINAYLEGKADKPFFYLTQEEFINKIKTDPEFSEKWGLKIEERELSLEERFNIRYPGGKFSVFQENYPNTHKRNNPNDLLDAFDIPTKLITITYNDKTIESYE
jgi:lysophospholipase L1-like esterase